MNFPSLRYTLLAGLLVVGSATIGCGNETGIIIEVSRDDSVPAQVDRLRFFIGVEFNAVDLQRGFIDDGDRASDVSMDSRDLVTDPYDLLLRKGDGMTGGVAVAVVAFANDQMVGFGGLESPVQFIDGKVIKWPVELSGNFGGRVDITDTSCLIWTDAEGNKVVIASSNDHDCDGDAADVDCNDNDPTVGPSSPEICANGVDDNCNGEKDETIDADMDGVNNCEDCDDTDPDRTPGKTEICDGKDNDCNGICDDGDLDADGDKYTVCNNMILGDNTCSSMNENLFDCNDNDPDVHPGAEEVCDGIDNNCNLECDEGFDEDGDKYTTCGSRTDVCNGTRKADIDCEPNISHVNPGMPAELCDGYDTNCDGVLYPELVPCYGTGSGDTCLVGERICQEATTVGQGWKSGCDVTAATQSVPGTLCDAYETCDSNDVADPFACANNAVAMQAYSCTLAVRAGMVCPNARALLPNVGDIGASCTWLLGPANAVQHYDVQLESVLNGTTADTSLAECEAIFGITGILVPPPVPDSYILYQTANTASQVFTQVFTIDVTPQQVVDCPVKALSCIGLVSPAPTGP